MNNVNLNNEIPDTDIKKINNTIRESLEGEITYDELTTALRNMKNEKSPGSDGFTNEFFKFFWIDIGKFVFRSIIIGYEKGELSITQRLYTKGR